MYQNTSSNEVYQKNDNDFVRLQKDDYTYYGQVRFKEQKPDEYKEVERHGIGTIMFTNGFIYKGMFEEDQMTGIGTSEDSNFSRYVG